MATRTYERMASIEDFGADLLRTGDLDPLYIALHFSGLPEAQMKRWLLAYWCCYHAGASSFLSESEGMGYWSNLRWMAQNPDNDPSPTGGRWPRGHERRHFRGDKAVRAVEDMRENFETPEQLVDGIIKAGPSFKNLRAKTMELPLFGPWIAFKVGDMLERVLRVQVDFTDADVLMFEQPYTSALAVWNANPHGASEIARSTVTTDDERVRRVVKQLLIHFGEDPAPPFVDDASARAVNIQEVETILCKWKSHLSGSYPRGNDIHELRHGLAPWAEFNETAAKILEAAPCL